MITTPLFFSNSSSGKGFKVSVVQKTRTSSGVKLKLRKSYFTAILYPESFPGISGKKNNLLKELTSTDLANYNYYAGSYKVKVNS